MDGIPALDLWDLVIEVLHSSQQQLNETKGLSVQGNLLRNTTSNQHTQNQTNVPTTHDTFDLYHVDSVPSNVIFLNLVHQAEHILVPMLYVLEDNEVVIKMMIKGRSPTTRMCQEPTELLLIGCLTRLTWILRFKLGTSTHQTSVCRHIDKREFHM